MKTPATGVVWIAGALPWCVLGDYRPEEVTDFEADFDDVFSDFNSFLGVVEALGRDLCLLFLFFSGLFFLLVLGGVLGGGGVVGGLSLIHI